MPENDALLKAVIASPDDDLPRLVYADWQEENGDAERAEFIRTQIELAKSPTDPRAADWQVRKRELLDTHGWRWAEPLGRQVSEWQFRRGFIEAVEISLEQPAAEFLPVFDLAPVRHIRDVGQFCDLSGVIEALPRFAQLTGLEFWGLYSFDDELIRQMLASPHLVNLRTLVLFHDRNGNTVPDDIIAEGLRSPHRAKLERLVVNVDGMWRGPTREVLAAMADSPHLRNLKSLDLSHAGDGENRRGMGLATARALGASPNLAGVEELNLSSTSFDLETWDEVLRWPFLRRLKRLALNSARQVNPPSYRTVAEIAKLPAYRAEFEAAVPDIDWDTEFHDPWNSDRASWRGQSWGRLTQRHLFAMWPWVKNGRYDELETAYRKDCVTFAGEAAAVAVDALPFAAYATRLADAFRPALEAAGNHPECQSLWLRIRPDLNWNGKVHLSRESVPAPFEPREEGSYSGPLVEFEAGTFPEAGDLRRQHPDQAVLDPGSVLHYLLARTIAAFGRVVRAANPPRPVFFSCMYAVFRMY